MSATRKPPVHWSDGEVEFLQEKLVNIIAADHTIPLLTAIHRAEQSLEPGRRRLIRYLSPYGKRIREKFEAAYQKGLRTVPPPPPPVEVREEPEPFVTDTSEAEDPTLEMPAASERDAGPGAELMPILSGLSTPLLLAEVLVRIGADMLQRLDRIEAAVLSRITPEPPQPALPRMPTSARNGTGSQEDESEPKPKVVAVVGLLKDQFEHVREKVADLPFRLVWLDKEMNKPFIPGADFVIVERHCSHKWWTTAQRAVPRDCLVFCDGSITQVVQRVFDFHAKAVHKDKARRTS